jgi:hypothetical protein
MAAEHWVPLTAHLRWYCFTYTHKEVEYGTRLPGSEFQFWVMYEFINLSYSLSPLCKTEISVVATLQRGQNSFTLVKYLTQVSTQDKCVSEFYPLFGVGGVVSDTHHFYEILHP